ncbi:MAG TPA: hypothetical protein VF271_06860 [Rhodanobacteraceae bacterium]
MRAVAAGLAVTVLALAGCSQSQQPTPAQKAATQKADIEAAAQAKLTMFNKLLGMQRGDLAIPIGEEVLAKYPHTKAAAQIAKVLPGLKTKVKAAAEKRRLAGLWLYQVSPMAGGKQSTAAIDPSKPAGSRVQLVLRRQSSWGTSAFLYDHKTGEHFACHKLCDIVMHFDGVQHVYKGYLPNGGEPAMFVKDYKSFIARLSKAKNVDMTVTIAGQGKVTLAFETGGFDAGKWVALPKKK